MSKCDRNGESCLGFFGIGIEKVGICSGDVKK